jgi:glycosyltransferase involved in cell wall biosynthesis
LTGPEIAVLLPYAEHFGPEAAGAIALHVRDAARASRFRDLIRIHGRRVERPFEDVPFEPLEPAWRGVLGRNRGLAEALHRRLRGRPPLLVELHNRPQMFRHLAWRNPRLALAIRFANDPQTMRHARSVPARTRILQRASAVYCVSDYVRDRFLDGVVGDRHKAHVVITGIERTQACGLEKEPLIVCAGRISEDKGTDHMVEALTRVLPRRPEWRAEIIGSGTRPGSSTIDPLERRLRELSRPLGDRISWPGFVTNDEVTARFGRAAIVVIPSRWPEPLARTAIEALAAGAAVIAYPTGGLPEVLRGRGLLVDPPSAESLTEALARVIDDESLRRRLQQQARNDYPFDLAAMAGRLDEIRAAILAEVTEQRR